MLYVPGWKRIWGWGLPTQKGKEGDGVKDCGTGRPAGQQSEGYKINR